MLSVVSEFKINGLTLELFCVGLAIFITGFCSPLFIFWGFSCLV